MICLLEATFWTVGAFPAVAATENEAANTARYFQSRVEVQYEAPRAMEEEAGDVMEPSSGSKLGSSYLGAVLAAGTSLSLTLAAGSLLASKQQTTETTRKLPAERRASSSASSASSSASSAAASSSSSSLMFMQSEESDAEAAASLHLHHPGRSDLSEKTLPLFSAMKQQQQQQQQPDPDQQLPSWALYEQQLIDNLSPKKVKKMTVPSRSERSPAPGSLGAWVGGMALAAAATVAAGKRNPMQVLSWRGLSTASGSVRAVPRATEPAMAPQIPPPTVGVPGKDVGIVAMDCYFPKRYVAQEALEKFDGVSAGKYTAGLGQKAMAFTDDHEDIYSMALTATKRLLDRYDVNPKDIGRLEVGTETVLDKSKSIKTILMDLFSSSGNYDVEGVDNINACYGGTAALLNSINWVESSSWDGRYALVVTGDIAVYEPGPARPTGGACVVAMLIGPDAPLAIEPGLRGNYMEHAYDFYKPNLDSEYPVVDGHGSIGCYLRALDSCYANYGSRFERQANKAFSLEETSYALFHSPFTKMVRKSYQRMWWLDFVRNPEAARFAEVKDRLQPLLESLGTSEASYGDRDLAKALADATAAEYEQRVQPSLLLPEQLGNSYTASLYTGLLSLISNVSDQELLNQRLLMFSYGSGLAATLFSLRVRKPLAHIRDTSNIHQRLSQRLPVAPEEFTASLALREQTHNLSNYAPDTPNPDHFFPGTFCLSQVDQQKRRFYDAI